MKKHYIRIAVVIEVLILAVFALGSVSYLNLLAGAEMRYRMEQMKVLASVNAPKANADISEEDFIKNAYTSYFDNFQDYRQKNTGFYGKLILKDGTELDTANDYAYVYLTDDTYIENTEKRIICLEDDFVKNYDQPSLYEPVFDGECDDIFIHGGNMTTLGKTYKLRDLAYEKGNRRPVSEWQGESGLHGEVLNFARNAQEQKLNEEAKGVYTTFTQNLKNGTANSLSNEITSYHITYVSTSQGVFITVQVCHPLLVAFTGHIGAFIAILVAFLFIEAAVAIIVSKLYKNRLEYENKSKRLTRGIAHELKTPLAVTKAYVDNWDVIDEEDRAEYAEKINREVEDMSDMISTLLEMEKINDGSIRLNIEEVELSSLMKSVYNRLKPLAEERALTVNFPDEKEYLVKADLKYMKIALGNYLTNMVKYADKSASVSIEENGRKYRISFVNDSTNDQKSKTDKLNNNGMGVEINENIMKLHDFKCGSDFGREKTVFWFEADKA